jgi:hypothetical protein
VRDLAVKQALEAFASEAAERLRDLVERGEELPYDITGPGEGSPFVQYTPQTVPFIREHASALTGLPSFRTASAAIAEAELGEAYLDVLGEPAPDDRDGRAEAAALAFLCRLWEGLGDFTIDDTRLAEAVAELEGSESMPVGEAEIVVPLVGFHMPTTRLELGMTTLVRADTVEVPDEAARPEGTRKAGWEPQFLAAVRAPDGDEPVAGPGPLLRGVVTTLRLFKEGGVGLAPYAWARTRGDRWKRIPTGVGRPRPGGYRLGDGELGDLAAFAQGLTKRSGLPSAPSGGGPGPGGALERAISRFEAGLERPALLEAVCDYLLALRFLLEDGGPANVGMPMRVAALCAEADARPKVRETVVRAQALERELMGGGVPAAGGSPLELVSELEALLRRMLRDAVIGELGEDLRAAADEILLADGLAAGEGAATMRGATAEWDAIVAEEPAIPVDEPIEVHEIAPEPIQVQEVAKSAAKGTAEETAVTDALDASWEIAEERIGLSEPVPESKETQMSTPDAIDEQPTNVDTDWLSEVDDSADPVDIDWPERPEALRLLDQRPAERERARRRVRHLFPRPETTEWSVTELRYSRKRAVG